MFWELWYNGGGNNDPGYVFHWPGDTPAMRATMQLVLAHITKMKNQPNTSTNAPPTPGGIVAGASSGNSPTLNWTASPNVHLQSATNLARPVVWTDVPNTTGQGSATVTTTNTRMFFRLIQPQ